jgi:hypothetical protein
VVDGRERELKYWPERKRARVESRMASFQFLFDSKNGSVR